MIKPENREKLREEITQKTGLNVLDIKIEDVNLVRNSAFLRIYYAENNNLKDVRSSENESSNTKSRKINGDRKPWNKNKGIELLRKMGSYSLKTANSWLLMIILITLILIFGVTMDGFALLA